MATTLYHRTDFHAVNGLYAQKLLNTQGDQPGLLDLGLFETQEDVIYQAYVYIRHQNGSRTTLGAPVALDYYVRKAVNGISEATWACPGANLAQTDALEVHEIIDSLEFTGEYWVTPQLGAVRLGESTWTWYRWINFRPSEYAELRYGHPTYNTRIEGIELVTLQPPELQVEQIGSMPV